jgi:hypothetical protein
MTRRQVSALTQLHEQTISRWSRTGRHGFPAPIRAGKRFDRFDRYAILN